jgi:hypothetical protein
MTHTGKRMLDSKPNGGYYIAVDVRTQEVIAVLDALDEREAQQFFAAVCHMLQVPPEAKFRVLEGLVPPNETPIFHRQYLTTLQANAQDEARAWGDARH